MSLVQMLKLFYIKSGRRYLPWRKTKDPYKIFVSEVMLQQTQVHRVLPKYKAFLQRFNTVGVLARADFKEVLAEWSGLGYNRRAKFLHEAAKTIRHTQRGIFPSTTNELELLPGVGPYTARAIAAFAYNQPVVFVETNIRTVFVHFYFKDKEKVADTELLPLIKRDLKQSKMDPRDFYAALMDYGAHLKVSGVRINKKNVHYIKQARFKGSARQLRGAIIRGLLKNPTTAKEMSITIAQALKIDIANNVRVRVECELKKLCKEEMVMQRGKRFSIKK